MDEYLSNKPFIRSHWWSRCWAGYITIQPPLTKKRPLWKRSEDELIHLRLFNTSPEELGRKIERYWKKPRWRRWFASFGMNKKIDVWNYYQRCLAYKEVRQDNSTVEQSLIVANDGQRILDDLASVLHKSNVKFEFYLEKKCRDLNWVEKHFSEEIKRYQKRMEKTFSLKLSNYLTRLGTEEQLIVKQKAEKEYQQVEAFMFRYYHLWNFKAFCNMRHSEVGIDVVNNRERNENQERRVAVYSDQGTEALSQSSISSEPVANKIGIGSLHTAKEWIQVQRQRLKSLIEEDSPQKVKELLQESMNDIKDIIAPHLECCENIVLNMRDNNEVYETSLNVLIDLQNRLKPLLQGGLRLFHPDHVMGLNHSEEIWKLITEYSQAYLEQSRSYLGKLQGYQQRLYAYYEQRLLAQEKILTLSELKTRIDKLRESQQEMYHKFMQNFAEMELDLEAKWTQDLADMETRWKQYLVDMEAKCTQDLTDMETRWMQRLENIEKNKRVAVQREDSPNRINEQASSLSDFAEKPINCPSFKN